MNAKPRLTKQGIRDLNYYGPKPKKAAVMAPAEVTASESQVAPPAVAEGPAAPPPVAE
jgi:hypothetical protein